MADYPDILTTGQLKKFLSHIQLANKPPLVTQKYLEQAGFKTKNERRIISVLKHVGFIDQSNVPTDDWQKYRNKENAPRILGTALKSSYSDLFDVYPDANNKDVDTLRNFFSANTAVGDGAVRAMVGTFKALVDVADLNGMPDEQQEADESQIIAQQGSEKLPSPVELAKQLNVVGNGKGIGLNINIEIVVPESTNPEVYDNFFKSLKKHILTNE